ncbi:MAG: glycoside hydrolase family 3 C-terminal domain-containing protein, partial [Anaerolineales bacterium]|nr:glycoside hydrolase family 3 C-terminal domain-containing protein [Anaerolineales bacterium]
MKSRVAELISKMTLEEKISQMLFTSPAIDRLNVPQYNWWNEALHGVGRSGVATVFPQAIALAATWNSEMMSEIAEVISDEARAKHHEALRRNIREIYTGLTFWSPNINIFRDPRWGRGQETYGEDPYLTAVFGTEFVKKLQGDDPDYLKLVATLKHFAVHSGPESSRHHFDAVVDEKLIREFYLFAFEACVKEADPVSVMGAYNRVNGEPACSSIFLLETVLREEWGFDGYVVSDCEAIRDIFENHKVVDTAAEAAALAVKNGCELNCGSVYIALKQAVEQGLIDEVSIDAAVTKLFIARFMLGMFDDPKKVPFASIPYSIVDSPKHQEKSLEASRESLVLLKNEDNLLPLKKDKIKSIAVIGPNADDVQVLVGNYNGTPNKPVTLLRGIKELVGENVDVLFSEGCQLAKGKPFLETIPAKYLRPLSTENGNYGLTGTYFGNPKFEGTPVFTKVDPHIEYNWKNSSPINGEWGEHFSVRWEGYLVPPETGEYCLGATGFSGYRLFLDGKNIAEYYDIHHPQVVSSFINLEAGKMYHLVLEYINRGIDAQVQLLWGRERNTYVNQAMEIAAKADVIVCALGLSPSVEGEEMPVDIEGFVGGDRTKIDLPDTQQELLEKLITLGKPIVLVVLGGSAIAIPWAKENIPAIVNAWYPGQSGGQALAELLFGEFNPSGKLPITLPKSIEDLPPFDDYQIMGRTYRYLETEPLYPFGYGLSYTEFEFSDLEIKDTQIAEGETTEICIKIRNIGKSEGKEVVQLYTSQEIGSEYKPKLELKGFVKVPLSPGEEKVVTFTVSANQFGMIDESMKYVLPDNTVKIMIGNSSENLPLQSTIKIAGGNND